MITRKVNGRNRGDDDVINKMIIIILHHTKIIINHNKKEMIVMKHNILCIALFTIFVHLRNDFPILYFIDTPYCIYIHTHIHIYSKNGKKKKNMAQLRKVTNIPERLNFAEEEKKTLEFWKNIDFEGFSFWKIEYEPAEGECQDLLMMRFLNDGLKHAVAKEKNIETQVASRSAFRQVAS